MRRIASPNEKPFAPRLVGVIASPPALVRAVRLRRPPDLFEVRLDAFANSLGQLRDGLSRLGAPLILTARHPLEGGVGELNFSTRRKLLRNFLDHATFVDLELRSVRRMKTLLDEMRRRKTRLIVSYHDFHATPSPEKLLRLTKSAAAFRPSFFKIVVRLDAAEQLHRLVTFFMEARGGGLNIAAMGVGRWGLRSRLHFDRLGSAFTYVSLGEANAEGQPSLNQLRRARRAYTTLDMRAIHG
jgi:3-dehydroquinate dehydratase I